VRADTETVFRRLRREDGGFGLVELIVAMALLNVGILALVAVFNSGAVAVQRSARVSTASVLADRQLELYRAVKYTQIGLVPGLVATADADSYYAANWPYTNAAPPATKELSCATATKPECKPIQTVTGPDGRTYRVDTYIVQYDFEDNNAATAALRKVKVVRILVRDGSALATVLARQESNFDQSTGL
jgi:Tfp pilus assembly protein PilV